MSQPVVDCLRAAGCVFAEEEARLLLEAARDEAHLEAMVTRRVAGEPLEYVVGWAAFHGLRVAVGPGVFVPRRRTEHLVDVALRHHRSPALVVDLCCGSGALGLAFVTALSTSPELHAADVTEEAVACARENLGDLGTVHHGDLFHALPDRLRGRVDVLLANTPYVPTDEVALLPGEAREHEPRSALDGGADGLHLARRVLDGAAEWLAPGGTVHIEVSQRQVAALTRHARQAGLHVEVEENTFTAGIVGPSRWQ